MALNRTGDPAAFLSSVLHSLPVVAEPLETCIDDVLKTAAVPPAAAAALEPGAGHAYAAASLTAAELSITGQNGRTFVEPRTERGRRDAEELCFCPQKLQLD